jgi:hypothetical protein
MSVNKSLVSTQVSSSITINDDQTEDVEFIFLIPSKSSISFSTFSVIKESMSSGFTQGYVIAIFIIPNFTSGLDSFGIV